MKALVLVSLAAAMAACTPAEPATPQEVVFTATNYAFAGPDTILPGVTTIRMVNRGESTHHMIMARFEDGFGVPDMMAFVETNPNGVPAFMTFRGAAGAVPPGGETGGTVDLPAGNYVLVCFIPDSMGVPHMAHGMMKEFVVAGERHEAPLPTATGEIHLRDFAFSAIEARAGANTFHVINDGPQIHEIQLMRLHEGATVEQVLAAMAPGAASPPPADDLGGPGAYSPGRDGYWTVDLPPGNYLVLCFVPDTDGVPHVMKGMMQAFTVPAT